MLNIWLIISCDYIKKKILFRCSNVRDVPAKFYVTYTITSSIVF